MVTTRCSAGCAQCPFSDAQMPKLDLPPSTLAHLLSKAKYPYVTLSGGEVFEYPKAHLHEILVVLAGSQVKFRIATGGHVPLQEYATHLKSMTNLVGISIGTDVLKGANRRLKAIWHNNVTLLNDLSIPYSLTFTVIESGATTEQMTQMGSRLSPEFLFLRYSDDAALSGLRDLLGQKWPRVPVITENILR